MVQLFTNEGKSYNHPMPRYFIFRCSPSSPVRRLPKWYGRLADM